MSASLCLVWAAFAVLAPQGGTASDEAEAKAAAQKGLATLQQMVTEKNRASLGFESLKDASSSSLGEGLRISIVRLDELKTYAAGGDPEKLLHALDRSIFPVAAGEKVQAAITVEKSQEGDRKTWKATGFGMPALAKAVFGVRQRVTAAAAFLVQVPALNLSMVAHRENNTLMLTPTLDDARFEFKAGGTTAAKDLFAKLVPAAQKDDGLPK
jgi:hypothetical protein